VQTKYLFLAFLFSNFLSKQKKNSAKKPYLLQSNKKTDRSHKRKHSSLYAGKNLHSHIKKSNFTTIQIENLKKNEITHNTLQLPGILGSLCNVTLP
jgi:hypothetical protein